MWDRIVLEAALEALDAMEEGEAKKLVAGVVALHGLATVEDNRAWYLEKGYLEPSRARQSAGKSTGVVESWRRGRWSWWMRSASRIR